MERTRRHLGLIASLAAAAAALLAVPQPAHAALDPWSCVEGRVCVYSGPDGTGSVCAWPYDDPDWQSGDRCSWSATTKVRSVYNHGGSGRPVAFYPGANYTGQRVVCTAAGARGNFSQNGGTGVHLRSHRWSC
ncbi:MULTISPECIES: peptidase inhibitor family I36 protein [unclassified Kitasatospora]|uniref:peptidase inhibitor family I36 protein n=1 Tax=unclassified Kitasatospora TaxID=2633591 RepID=UPI0036B4AF85